MKRMRKAGVQREVGRGVVCDGLQAFHTAVKSPVSYWAWRKQTDRRDAQKADPVAECPVEH